MSFKDWLWIILSSAKFWPSMMRNTMHASVDLTVKAVAFILRICYTQSLQNFVELSLRPLWFTVNLWRTCSSAGIQEKERDDVHQRKARRRILIFGPKQYPNLPSAWASVWSAAVSLCGYLVRAHLTGIALSEVCICAGIYVCVCYSLALLVHSISSTQSTYL